MWVKTQGKLCLQNILSALSHKYVHHQFWCIPLNMKTPTCVYLFENSFKSGVLQCTLYILAVFKCTKPIIPFSPCPDGNNYSSDFISTAKLWAIKPKGWCYLWAALFLLHIIILAIVHVKIMTCAALSTIGFCFNIPTCFEPLSFVENWWLC